MAAEYQAGMDAQAFRGWRLSNPNPLHDAVPTLLSLSALARILLHHVRLELIEARFAEIQLVDHPFVTHRVDSAPLIRAEGDESLRNAADLTHGLQLSVFLGRAKDPFGSVITTQFGENLPRAHPLSTGPFGVVFVHLLS